MKKVLVDVTARFAVEVELDIADDEEGLTEEEESEVEDQTMQALSTFSFRGQRIKDEDPPVIEVDARMPEVKK